MLLEQKDMTTLDAKIQALYKAGGIEKGLDKKADDFFFMTPGDPTKNSWKNHEAQSFGWIQLTAVAAFYNYDYTKLKGGGKGPGFYIDPDPLANQTGAGGLYCAPIRKGPLPLKGFFGDNWTRPEDMPSNDRVKRIVFAWWDAEKDGGKTHMIINSKWLFPI
jgi:hypothetical protein